MVHGSPGRVMTAPHWLRGVLLKPLRPGSRVFGFSSGAALNPNGSPLSDGHGADDVSRLTGLIDRGNGAPIERDQRPRRED